MLETVVFFIALIVMIIGFSGTILPMLPGTPVIFFAALVFGALEGFDKISSGTLLVLAIITLFTILVDYISGVLGAKKYGATKGGTWGALIGGFLGIFMMGPIGIIIGPLSGAIIGEIIMGKKLNDAFKVGYGTMIGLLGGALIKIITAGAMIVLFIWDYLNGIRPLFF